MLAFCLRFKIVPLSIAIGLLAFSVWAVLRMGLVMIPEMTSNQIQVSITMPEDIDKEESFRIADQAVDAILTVDGVEMEFDKGLLVGGYDVCKVSVCIKIL